MKSNHLRDCLSRDVLLVQYIDSKKGCSFVQCMLHLHKCNSCCIFQKYVPNNFYAQDLITEILYGFLKNVRNVTYRGLLANWHLRIKVCPFVAPYARIIELGFRLHTHSIHSMQCANHNQER